MKLNFSTLAAISLLVASASASPMAPQEAQAGCTLTGTYVNSNDIATCSNVVISNLQVPAGVTLDLTKVKSGATITFQGTTTFGTEVTLSSLSAMDPLRVMGRSARVAHGHQPHGQRPGRARRSWGMVLAERHQRRSAGLLPTQPRGLVHALGFTLKNSPFRTFSILNSVGTHLTGLTLDSSAGDNHAKNTDGFDLSHNKGVHITNNNVHNQDDCLAMQSSVDTVFSGNSCTGGHGISVGSIGRDVVDESSTVSGLIVDNNKISNSESGLRIKTIVGMKGLVTGVTYTRNVVANVKHAIALHSDYDGKGYNESPTSQVTIRNITIAGLSGTATNVYDILVNPSVVSDWHFSGITVSGAKGSCKGQPSSIAS